MTRLLGRRPVLQGLAATAALIAAPAIVRAAEKLTVAKSIADALPYTPIDVGLAKGIYQKHGLELDVVSFAGSAGMHQAMTAGSLDIELGSGSTMVDVLKGEPSLCIAQTLGPPVDLMILVGADSPLTTTDDLKGKTVGVATAGSPTQWVVFELARQKGWAKTDIATVGLGGTQAAIAALKVHQTDAVVASSGVGFQLEATGAGRILARCSDYIGDFIMHANYASNKVIAERPAALRAFNAAWFESVAYMQAHRDEGIELVLPVTHLAPAVEAKDYDLVIPLMSRDGRFDPKGVAAIARSYIELKILDKEPDMSKLYSEAYLPKA